MFKLRFYILFPFRITICYILKREYHKIIFNVFQIQTNLLSTGTVVLTSVIGSIEKKFNNQNLIYSRNAMRLRKKLLDNWVREKPRKYWKEGALFVMNYPNRRFCHIIKVNHLWGAASNIVQKKKWSKQWR